MRSGKPVIRPESSMHTYSQLVAGARIARSAFQPVSLKSRHPPPPSSTPYPGLDPNSLPQSLIEQGRKGLGTRHVRNQIAHGPPTDGTPCVQLDRTGVGATGIKTLLRAEREQGWCVYVHYEVRTSYGTTRSAH